MCIPYVSSWAEEIHRKAMNWRSRSFAERNKMERSKTASAISAQRDLWRVFSMSAWPMNFFLVLLPDCSLTVKWNFGWARCHKLTADPARPAKILRYAQGWQAGHSRFCSVPYPAFATDTTLRKSSTSYEIPNKSIRNALRYCRNFILRSGWHIGCRLRFFS